MEKFESKIGILSFIVLAFVCFLNIAAVCLFILLNIWWPMVIVTLILFMGIVPCFFSTYYKINNEEIYIKSGFYNKTIKTENIISVTPIVGYKWAPALSSKRVKIEYLENGKVKEIEISPVLLQVFLEEFGEYVLVATINKPEEVEENVASLEIKDADEVVEENNDVAVESNEEEKPTSTTTKKTTTKKSAGTKKAPAKKSEAKTKTKKTSTKKTSAKTEE
ncbi:MAG: PH domain-containing protein [Clostridia bacterium]|nr:PH domain-containing protein [Clostridia bacterium]